MVFALDILDVTLYLILTLAWLTSWQPYLIRVVQTRRIGRSAIKSRSVAVFAFIYVNVSSVIGCGIRKLVCCRYNRDRDIVSVSSKEKWNYLICVIAVVVILLRQDIARLYRLYISLDAFVIFSAKDSLTLTRVAHSHNIISKVTNQI